MYATLANLQDRYSTDQLIQLTDDAGQGVIDVARIEAVLADAQNEIDSYVAAAKYQLPLSQPEPNLTRYACDIAVYYLHRNLVPDLVKDRYEQALAWLKKLAKGEVLLTIGGVQAPAVTNTIEIACNLVADRRAAMRGF